ncbi:MAG: hypothetical protein KTR31_18320 [Myxococcales bacterium]|nr:hypothetical protein [Myxococcales bacterium]
MASTGIKGFYVETHNYGATGAFWKSLGFRAVFETDHSGQWVHPDGGIYVFVNELPEDQPLGSHLILGVENAAAFAPERAVDWEKRFANEHWGEAHGLIRDPDGRRVALQAPPLP